MKLLFENWRRFLVEEQHPEINDRDVLESIAHLNNEEGEEDKFSREDFKIEYYGRLNADDVTKILDEPTDWLALDPKEAKNYKDPSEYLMNKGEFDRGEFESKMDFVDRSLEWIEAGELPPIYVIQNSKYKNILGDGRGRLNVARGFDLKVPVFYMKLVRHRTEEPTIYNSELSL